jgi:hypothetical protein
MDMREASAMTEASGLTNDPDGGETSHSGTAMQMDRRDPLSRMAEQLRRMTVAAPLPSLFIAFLAGIMVARRR